MRDVSTLRNVSCESLLYSCSHSFERLLEDGFPSNESSRYRKSILLPHDHHPRHDGDVVAVIIINKSSRCSTSSSSNSSSNAAALPVVAAVNVDDDAVAAGI